MVNILAGCSGSGKTTFYRNNKNANSVCVCPDDLRKEITGNISDQTKNKEVFELAYSNLNNYCKTKKEIWFDATNLNKESLNKIISVASKNNQDCSIYVFEKSFDFDECNCRVRQDIAHGVNRSNVPEDIIKKQHERFKSLYKNLDSIVSVFKKAYPNIKISVNHVEK